MVVLLEFLLAVKNDMVSSAKSNRRVLKLSGISLMYIE